MYEENLWRHIVCNDVLTTMMLLGCDEKYLNGQASDFECFREWIASYPFMMGNETADKIAEAIGGAIGRPLDPTQLCSADASVLWRCHCGKYADRDAYDLCDEKLYKTSKPARVICSDEKEKITSSIFDMTEALLSAGEREIDTLEKFEKSVEITGNTQISIKVEDGEFVRPDRYHGEKCYLEYISGEILNLNYILSQIALDLIYGNKCEIIHFIIENKSGLIWVNEFIKYLSFRKLNVKSAVHFHSEVTPEEVRDTCIISDKVIPVMSAVNDENIEKISRIVPKGIMVL